MKERGFSLVELMIAMTLSLLLIISISSLFLNFGQAHRRLGALSTVLDNGRHALGQIAEEARLAGADYCNGYENLVPSGGQTARRPLRFNLASAAALPSWVNPPAGASAPFEADPGRLIRVHDCDANGQCNPPLPGPGEDVNELWPPGIGNQMRLPGTDVLTVRYLRGPGVPVKQMASAQAPILLNDALQGAALEMAAPGPMLIADCARSEVFVGQVVGASVEHGADLGNADDSLGRSYQARHDARLFNFARDFVTVTWFVGLQPDLANPALLRPTLMRMQNGEPAQEVAIDVDRFDLRVDLQIGDGKRVDLSPGAINGNPAALPCPPDARAVPDPTGCLWRGLATIDIAALFASPPGTELTGESFRYSEDGDALQSYAANQLLPTGLAAGNRLRREFSAQVAFRNSLR